MNTIIINLFLALIEAPILLNCGTKKFGKQLYLSVIFVQLVVVHAFLDPYRMFDLPNYMEAFNLTSRHSLKYILTVGFPAVKMEDGWLVLCKVLSLFSGETSILVVTSVIMVGAICIASYKYSPYVWITVVLWLLTYFNQSLFVLRQHTAMAICLLSIPFILRRDLLKFCIVVALAFSIHKTAIIFVALYFLYGMKMSWSLLLKLSIASIAGLLVSKYIFSWFFQGAWYGSYADIGGANFTTFAMGMCVVLLFLLSKNWRINNLTDIEKLFFMMLCLYVCISVVGHEFILINRLGKYFGLAVYFTIPMSIASFKNNGIKMLATVCVLLCYMLLWSSEFIGRGSVYISGYTNTLLGI
jgi:hypothetical protein